MLLRPHCLVHAVDKYGCRNVVLSQKAPTIVSCGKLSSQLAETLRLWSEYIHVCVPPSMLSSACRHHFVFTLKTLLSTLKTGTRKSSNKIVPYIVKLSNHVVVVFVRAKGTERTSEWNICSEGVRRIRHSAFIVMKN